MPTTHTAMGSSEDQGAGDPSLAQTQSPSAGEGGPMGKVLGAGAGAEHPRAVGPGVAQSQAYGKDQGRAQGPSRPAEE